MIGKFKPKIMICNVCDEEDVGEALVDRNQFLRSIPGVKGKIKLLFSKPVAGRTTHVILKCEPEIRWALQSI